MSYCFYSTAVRKRLCENHESVKTVKHRTKYLTIAKFAPKQQTDRPCVPDGKSVTKAGDNRNLTCQQVKDTLPVNKPNLHRT